MEIPSSKRLLQQYANQRQVAFEIDERYRSRIIGLAAKRISPTLLGKVCAEDIAQESLASFFQMLDENKVRWEKEGDLWRLISGIAIKKVLRQQQHFLTDKRNSALENSNASLLAQQPDHYQDIAAVELTDLINQLLSNEKPLTQEVLRLRLCGLSQAEIATSVGRTTRTVRRVIELIRTRFLDSDQFSVSTEAPENSRTKTALPEMDIDQLVLLRLIGQGSFSKVYLAKLKSPEKFVAVKIMKRNCLQDQNVRQTFRNEVQFLSSFQSAGTTRGLGQGSLNNGALFIVQELIIGEAFPDEPEAAFPPELLEQLTRNLATALNEIHSAGWLHGDLKRANILVTPDGMTKLIDFGLSHSCDDAASFENEKQQLHALFASTI